MRQYKTVGRIIAVGFAAIALACACYTIWGLRTKLDFIWGPTGLTSKALKCLMRGDLDNALAFADRAVQIAPNFPHAHEVLGEVLEVRGEFREAIREYTKVVSAREYGGLVLRGRVYEKVGERDKAAADYCDAVLSHRTPLNVRLVASDRVRRPGHYPVVEAQPDAIPSLLKFIDEAIERDPDNRNLRECRELILGSEQYEGDGAGAVQ